MDYSYDQHSYIDVPLSEETKKFATQILIWKKTRQTFYANDILNMLIDAKLISVDQIKTIVSEIETKEVKATLPGSHIMV